MKLLKKIGGMINSARRVPRKAKSCVKKIIGVMEAFDLVVERCFGIQLNGDYEEAIRNFSVKYRALNISMIPKVQYAFRVLVPESFRDLVPKNGKYPFGDLENMTFDQILVFILAY